MSTYGKFGRGGTARRAAPKSKTGASLDRSITASTSFGAAAIRSTPGARATFGDMTDLEPSSIKRDLQAFAIRSARSKSDDDANTAKEFFSGANELHARMPPFVRDIVDGKFDDHPFMAPR